MTRWAIRRTTTLIYRFIRELRVVTLDFITNFGNDERPPRQRN